MHTQVLRMDNGVDVTLEDSSDVRAGNVHQDHFLLIKYAKEKTYNCSPG